MPLPQHIQKVPTDQDNDREAYAPYNFVPLPEQVVLAEEVPIEHQAAHPRLVRQDRYLEGRYHGQIVCTLTTATPLYVRCGYTPEDFANYGAKVFHELTPEQQRERAQFFAHDDPEAPVIPGSSLRGMLRALVEIAGYGKMNQVMDRQLFYRSVSDRQYQSIFVEELAPVQVAPHPRARRFQTKVRSGFVRQRPGGYVIEECPMARIDHRVNNPRDLAAIPLPLGEQLMIGNGASKLPNSAYQHRMMYVICDPEAQDYFFNAQFDNKGKKRHDDQYLHFRGVRQASFDKDALAKAQESTLVITGHMQHKHMEFVFLHQTVATHPLSADLVKRFEDDDQITQWQEQAFRRDQPKKGARRRDGLLRDGEPVFFLLNDDGSIRFFGRAQLFRLPYGNAPFDFLPIDHQKDASIDLAEAIFGFVRRGETGSSEPRMVAGRVTIGDALFVNAQQNVWLSTDPITPHILASPKPTTFQHYLVQPEQTKADQHNLRRYDSSVQSTTLRGHKLYWHKGNVGTADIRETNEEKIRRSQKQYTKFRPVNEGVTFSFTIHFENLSSVELGALLWVLRLCNDDWQKSQKRGPYRLKLGMGKPLGMGAVHLAYEVQLSDRTQRYRSLLAGDAWSDPILPDVHATHAQVLADFEQYVLRESGELAKQPKDLHHTLRMQCLLMLLSWPGPPSYATRYMEIERDAAHPDRYRPGKENKQGKVKVNEYSNRLVLPTPEQVMKDHQPKHTTASTSTGSAELEIGKEFRGKILETVKVGVKIQHPQYPNIKQVIGLVAKEYQKGPFQPGRERWFEIIDVQQEEGTIILWLKTRSPNPNK